MAIISVQITGGEMIVALSSGAVTEATFAAAERAAQMIQDELQNFPFEGKGKGPHFGEKVRVTNNTTLAGISIEATSDVPHAVILEQGAKSHVYTSKSKAMTFGGGALLEAGLSLAPGQGQRVFAKKIQHPGVKNPPKPFEKTAAALNAPIAALFNDAIGSVLRGANVPLKGNLPSSVAAGIRVGRFQTGTRAGQIFLRGARGRFIPGVS